jgi:trehalose-phosphatase
VIGVDRNGRTEALKKHGADIVVTDLNKVLLEGKTPDPAIDDLPSALDSLPDIERRIKGRRIALFLDYDGTLTPIVKRPELAALSDDMRAALRKLASRCTVAIISGRDLTDVRDRVGLDQLFYAGSHGFDIAGPKGRHMENQKGTDFLPALDRAETALRRGLDKIEGARIERKKFSIATHYREVETTRVQAVEEVVDRVLGDHRELRKSHGKKVYDLQPCLDWHKGRAVQWLLESLGLDEPDLLPVYIGDDVTDEDAFKALEEQGISIVVGEGSRETAAQYALKDPAEVRRFLRALTKKPLRVPYPVLASR